MQILNTLVQKIHDDCDTVINYLELTKQLNLNNDDLCYRLDDEIRCLCAIKLSATEHLNKLSTTE